MPKNDVGTAQDSFRMPPPLLRALKERSRKAKRSKDGIVQAAIYLVLNFDDNDISYLIGESSKWASGDKPKNLNLEDADDDLLRALGLSRQDLPPDPEAKPSGHDRQISSLPEGSSQ